jgi:hypothetical protein
MKLNLPLRPLLIWSLAFPAIAQSQVSNDGPAVFKTLAAFGSAEKAWSDVTDIVINPIKPGSFKKTAGSGIILGELGKNGSRLSTPANFGDSELEFDFLVERGTIAAVLLQGRYQINLSDSWADLSSSFNSMGGIGRHDMQNAASFSGATPLIKVAKAPGLWQHVRIRFKAPEFTNGIKTANAVFEEVYINECLVQQNMELQEPSNGSVSEKEQPVGPVVFYGSNGILALRNLEVRKPTSGAALRPGGRRRVVNPIIITPEGSNYLLRSFLNFNRKKKTHVISVGNPREVNYSYDMKQGALLQVWNGPFVDVTDMWEQRGEPQLARPLGALIPLSENPALAVLQDMNTAWPDSISFDDLRTLGYTLDKQRNPAFEYETGGYHVWDKVIVGDENRSLTRQLNVTNAPPALYCRIARASAINSIGKGLYVAGDKSYYVQIDEKWKPFTRNTPNGVELLVPISTNKQLSYSLIW